MSNLKFICLQFLFLWLEMRSSTIAQPAWPARCPGSCGHVAMYYPFGIGSGCSLNDWYTIECRESSGSYKPYLSKLHLEVVGIFINNQTVTIKTSANSFCGRGSVTWNSINLTGSPFIFSKEYNRLVVFGCGNAMLLRKQNDAFSGCESTCYESKKKITGCHGINCCETSIPFYLREFSVNFTSSESSSLGSCSSAFLVDQIWYPGNYADSLVRASPPRYLPVTLLWTIELSHQYALSDYCTAYNASLELEPGKTVDTLTCACGALSGMQCHDPVPPRPPTPPELDRKKNLTGIIVGVATSTGVFCLVAAGIIAYKWLRTRWIKKTRERFFKRNGGLLLQKQLRDHDSIMETIRLFTSIDLEKATDNFNENRILGRGGQGIVYKGMLTDGRVIAVKRSKLVDESQLEQFINEVVVLSQVVHKNVVKLLGCCLETEVPLLVYEFIPNGTLFELIHSHNEEFFTWKIRLRIATEVAAALSYLHSAVATPIYHRDIKSSNIVLDEKYTAKVSDFGTSKSIAIDKTHITTLVKGTFGYLDPEYFRSSQFTEKSDVYSFGVVLVELLTKQKPVSLGPGGEDSNLSLVARFLVSMEQNCLHQILDAQLQDHSNQEEIIAVALLAEQCLNLSGKKRPTMREVAIVLERIRGSKVQQSPIIQTNLQNLRRFEEPEASFNASSSWTIGSRSSSTVSSGQISISHTVENSDGNLSHAKSQ